MAKRLIKNIGIITILALLLSPVLVGEANGLPDLVVMRIDIRPESPSPGSVVSITAEIGNAGESEAEGEIFVRFTVDGEEVNTSLIAGLRPGETETVSTAWIAEDGTHTISVEVDRPYQRILERDETNNTGSITVFIPSQPWLSEGIGGLRIAIARFEDRSRSGFLNVGEGVADQIADRLAERGARVLPRSELEGIMQERGLNPLSPEGIAEAASLLGAEIVITGVIDDIDFKQASLSIGFLRFSSLSADVTLSATPIAVDGGEPLFTVSAEGHDEGTSGFSIDIGDLLSLVTSSTPCWGGLRTDRPWYSIGEAASIGYRNPGPDGWYSLEIHSSTGAFVRWLGWEYIEADSCGRWFWDQKDSASSQVPPAVYVAKLWDGASYVASRSFQIRPNGGISIDLLEDITVGCEPFEETVVGAAVEQAVDRLATELISGIEEAGIRPKRVEAALSPAMTTEHRDGQIAGILPDGRIAINIGASAGVAPGDRFEVIETENLIVDPETLSIISYDAVGVQGEILIVEVRDNVSYAVKIGEFTPAIGDVVRFIGP